MSQRKNVPPSLGEVRSIACFVSLRQGVSALHRRKVTREYLFLKFDEIAERHGVEEIETVGDGYLAAGGVPSALDAPTARIYCTA